ncbi:hypothetical protein NXS19_007289 [Fusarium pseudograminearum]|nr:hypothetical protein NXS19_007289 [Fusarium pseudograminearum]
MQDEHNKDKEKRSKWKLFSSSKDKEKRKSQDIQPPPAVTSSSSAAAASAAEAAETSGDSTYGSSEPNHSLTTDGGDLNNTRSNVNSTGLSPGKTPDATHLHPIRIPTTIPISTTQAQILGLVQPSRERHPSQESRNTRPTNHSTTRSCSFSSFTADNRNSPAIPERNARRSAEFVPAPLQIGQGAFPPPPPPQDSSKPVNYSRPASKSTFANLKTAAAGIHGAGETLRGTLNSTVDKHFGGTPAAIEKNQAAIEAGRYEIDKGKFYHPNQYRLSRPHEDSGPSSDAPPIPDAQYDDPPFNMGNTTGSPAVIDNDRERRRSRLGSFFGKSTGRASSQPGADPMTPRAERQKLKKRSSSGPGTPKLSVVGERVSE